MENTCKYHNSNRRGDRKEKNESYINTMTAHRNVDKERHLPFQYTTNVAHHQAITHYNCPDDVLQRKSGWRPWSWFSMFTPDMGMAKSPNLSRLQIGVGRDPNTCRRWTLRVKTNEMKMNDNKWEVMDLG